MTEFRVNEAGFRAMATGPEIRAALGAVVDKVKAAAEADAATFRTEVDRPGHKHYADSFETDTTETTTVAGEPRAAARLTNTAPHAAAVEWGYKGRAGEPKTSAHRTLGKALERGGG